MRRTAGYVLFYVGLVVVLVAWAFRSPSVIGVNGYKVEIWLVQMIVGFALAACGVLFVRRSRTN